ncbi:AraC family transcriptional regulator [Pseudomonas sp. Seg1]|nr:AraC family transcriptional regulator [Pseudomonas sp. Seg1]
MRRATRFSVHPGWALLIDDLGVNVADVLKLAGLPDDLFARQDASLEPVEYCRFWLALEQLTQGEELPLIIGRAITAEAFDPPIFASLCSPNLEVALRRLAGYKALIGPLLLHIDQQPGYLEVRVEFPLTVPSWPSSCAMTDLVFFTQLARLATRKRICPLRVQLPNPPDNLHPYLEFFGCPVVSGQEIAIRFSDSDSRRPFLTANQAMWEFFRPLLDKRLSELDVNASMRKRVRGLLLELLPSGQVSIDAVAGRLAISRRSLQRHLEVEGCSYQEVLVETRRSLAEHYLSHSHISFPEVGYLLGFNDGNTFHRAFKSWVGITPGVYRSRSLGLTLS